MTPDKAMPKTTHENPNLPSAPPPGSGRIIDCVLAESQKLEVKIIDWTRGTGAYLDSVTRQLREYNAIGVIIINPPFNTPNALLSDRRGAGSLEQLVGASGPNHAKPQ